MPEIYIIYRHFFRKDQEYTQIWQAEYREIILSEDCDVVLGIIHKADFSADALTKHQLSKKAREFLRHYTWYKGKDDPRKDPQFLSLKSEYDKLIKKDQFVELTLTYDFNENENSTIDSSDAESKELVSLGIE